MRKITHVLIPVLFLFVILFCAFFAGTQLLGFAGHSPEQSFIQAEKGRALVVATGTQGDFPSASGLNKQEMKAELDALLAFACESGFDALYFEVTDGDSVFFDSKELTAAPDLAGFDPLAYLCRNAGKQKVDIFALAEASFYDTAALCAQLTEYDLAGVVFSDVENLEDPAEFCRMASSSLTGEKTRHNLGIVFDQAKLDPKLVGSLALEGTLDLVHPIMDAGDEEDALPYEEALARWSRPLQNTEAKLAIFQPLDNLADQKDRDELNCRLLTASMNPTVTGAVFSHYGVLLQHPESAEAVISHFADGGAVPVYGLDFQQELGLYAPAQSVVRLDNSYTTYFISGTSNPNLPLTLNGEEVERYTTNGVWGVQVELAEGTNVFTVAQGNTTAEVTFEVYDPAEAKPNPIDRITSGSLFPTVDRIFREGEEFTFTCVAPSGAAVTAHIDGQAIPMSQKSPTELPDIPATFEATYVMPFGNAHEVTSLGKVSYILEHNETTTEYSSAGQLFLAGKEANIMAQVDNYMIGIYTDATGSADVAANLNPGTRLCLQGEHQNGRELLRDVDLYAPMSSITVLTGKQESRITYQNITHRTAEKGEELVLGQGLNVCLPQLEEGLLTLTLLDTKVEGADNGLTLLEYDPDTEDTKKNETPPSDLFRRVTVENMPDGSAVFTMELQPEAALAGWDAYLDRDGQAVLYFQKAAVLSENYSRPLEGVTIMIDPGHGGSDPGAVGVAGAGGPTEAEVNLTLSHTLRYRLQQLGAKVIMTQDDNSRITIYDRYLMAQQYRPDLFISIHHNSVAVTRDANEIFYTIGYYYYPQSRLLAETAAVEVHQRVGRDLIESLQADYYVTRMSYAPSILFETGFVSNPKEQQECCDPVIIRKTANVLADAIVQSLAQPHITLSPVEIQGETAQ